jgi:hypothetical protein
VPKPRRSSNWCFCRALAEVRRLRKESDPVNAEAHNHVRKHSFPDQPPRLLPACPSRAKWSLLVLRTVAIRLNCDVSMPRLPRSFYDRSDQSLTLDSEPRPRSLLPQRDGRSHRRRGRSRNRRGVSLRRRRISAVRKAAPSPSAPSHDQEAHDCRLPPTKVIRPQLEATSGCK